MKSRMEKILNLVEIAKGCECNSEIVMDIAMQETIKNEIQLHAIGESMKQIPPIYMYFKSALVTYIKTYGGDRELDQLSELKRLKLM